MYTSKSHNTGNRNSTPFFIRPGISESCLWYFTSIQIPDQSISCLSGQAGLAPRGISLTIGQKGQIIVYNVLNLIVKTEIFPSRLVLSGPWPCICYCRGMAQFSRNVCEPHVPQVLSTSLQPCQVKIQQDYKAWPARLPLLNLAELGSEVKCPFLSYRNLLSYTHTFHAFIMTRGFRLNYFPISQVTLQ